MKHLLQKLRNSSFVRSEEGALMPIIGLSALVLFGATGMAIDMSRAQVVQSRLSNALDAAGLAAGSVANSGDIEATANKYFTANFPEGHMGVQLNDLVITPNADNSVLTLDITGEVNTTFMRIFGIETMSVAAHSEITRANQGMELVMVLDNTGSMSGDMNALKDAATTLINILYGENTEAENLWIGLVPFAQAVNIGTSRASWTSNPSMPSPGWGPTSWMGCVDAREASGRDVTDDPPSVALFPKYYWTCSSSYNAWYGNNSGKNDCDTTGGGFGYNTPLSTSRGPNKSCSQEVTPMTKYKATILSGINSMAARGNTHIVLGAAWGWRMLSPTWRGLWGGEMNTDELPLDYDQPLMNKVIIIMTDGENTIDNSNRGAYGYLSNGKLGTTTQSTAVTQLNTRLTQVCNSMKTDDRIIVYTIAFGNPGSTVENLLRGCASKPEYYFDSGDAAELQSAFEQIGDALANLRISK